MTKEQEKILQVFTTICLVIVLIIAHLRINTLNEQFTDYTIYANKCIKHMDKNMLTLTGIVSKLHPEANINIEYHQRPQHDWVDSLIYREKPGESHQDSTESEEN